MDVLPLQFSEDELMAALKPYQRNTLKILIAEHGDEKAAKLWISANGATNSKPFGGSPAGDTQPFWDLLLAEVREFVCDGEKYKQERQALIAAGNPTALMAVTAIALTVGPVVGLMPAMIVPAIAIVLKISTKIGLNAWCASTVP